MLMHFLMQSHQKLKATYVLVGKTGQGLFAANHPPRVRDARSPFSSMDGRVLIRQSLPWSCLVY